MSCEYCKDRKPLEDVMIKSERFVLIIDSDAEVMDVVSPDGIKSYATFVCNYCPICGDDWMDDL